jgi:uridine kinase
MNYLICGGSCAGKSTFSQMLSKKLDIEVYHVDEHIDGSHENRFDPIKHPVNHRILNKGIYWLFDQSPKQYADSNIQIANEDLEFVKDDIERLNTDIIIDGIWAEPSLVNSYFSNSKIIWLFPTKQHQRNVWTSREWTKDMLSEHKDPATALKNWVDGDYETSLYLAKRVKENQLPTYVLDNAKSVDDNFHMVTQILKL